MKAENLTPVFLSTTSAAPRARRRVSAASEWIEISLNTRNLRLFLLGKKPQHPAGPLIGEAKPRLGSRVEIDCLLVQPNHRRFSPIILGPRKVIRRMHRDLLTLLDGVVVQSQTFTRSSFGAGERIGKPVQRALVSGKDERVIQQRRILCRAARHLSLRRALPQFD